MPITGRIAHACVYQNRWFLSHAGFYDVDEAIKEAKSMITTIAA